MLPDNSNPVLLDAHRELDIAVYCDIVTLLYSTATLLSTFKYNEIESIESIDFFLNIQKRVKDTVIFEMA